jgi:hypothetical protein
MHYDVSTTGRALTSNTGKSTQTRNTCTSWEFNFNDTNVNNEVTSQHIGNFDLINKIEYNVIYSN